MIRFRRRVARLHYWLGWALGVFALSWFATGFFMSLKPIDEVRGQHIAAEPPFALTADRYSAPAIDNARSVTLIDALGTPAWVIERDGGREVVDARTGAPLSARSEAAIRAKARDVLKVDTRIVGLSRLNRAPWDYSGPLPVWQVTLEDPAGTRLYIDAVTGQLARVRTTRWRGFDVAWRIHILDPKGERISSWWLSLASGLAALFALTGLVLLWRPTRLSRKRRKASSDRGRTRRVQR